MVDYSPKLYSFLSDCLFRLKLIGDSYVGKSSLLLRFTDDSFLNYYTATIGIDFVTSKQKMRTITVRGKTIKLQVWDTAGAERFRRITPSYYKGIHGVLLVYDVTDRSSFDSVSVWINEIRRQAPSDTVVMIVGNKIDNFSERTVSTEDGARLAASFGVIFTETSAKTGHSVQESFHFLTSQILLAKTHPSANRTGDKQ